MPERMRGTGRLVAAAAIAVLVAAGCGSQSAEPKGKDWDEESQSEQQSQDKSESEASDEKGSDEGGSDKADEDGNKRIEGEDTGGTDDQTAAEVEAFMKGYLDAENEAIRDGDFSKVKPLIEDCQVCTASRKSIEEVYQNGGRIEGSLFTEPKIDVGRENKGTVTVTVVSTISAYKVIDDTGTVADQEPAKEQTFQYGVAKKGGEWKIVSGRFVI